MSTSTASNTVPLRPQSSHNSDRRKCFDCLIQFVSACVIASALCFHGYNVFIAKVSIQSLWNFGLPDPTRVFTLRELREFDGSDPNKPILLSFLGKVYDVSSGPQFYGAQGGYKFFAGRDATRAFITGCFQEECLLPDLTDIPESKLSALQNFVDTYDTKYIRVGVLDERDRISNKVDLEIAKMLETKQ